MQENNTTTNNDEVVTTDVEAGTQHIDSVVSTEITGAVTSEPVTREVSEDVLDITPLINPETV